MLTMKRSTMSPDPRTKMMHSVRLTISGEWVECWCGCGWKYSPPETDGTRLERLKQAQKKGHEHVEGMK